MNILVYGAGVLGSLYAARLQEAGQQVSLLARGRRLAELRQHGVVLEDAQSLRRTSTPVALVERLAPGDAYDLVLVLVRKTQLPGVLPALAANQQTPNVLFMVNSAEGPGALTQALGRERVLLGFPGAGGTREGHIVRYSLVPGQLQATTLGELDGRTTPRLGQIAGALWIACAAISIQASHRCLRAGHRSACTGAACGLA